MKRSFVKMHGCGNDYIYFDCMEQPLEHPEAWAVRLSDRHKGIGGDGLVMILPAEGADGRMRMFNADGSEGKMCGNAIRCVGKYLYDKGYAKKEQLCIQTLSGPKTLHMTVENGQAVAAKVDMGPAEFSAKRIPVALPMDRVIDQAVTIGGKQTRITCVSMGNPHCVVFVEDVETLPITKIGPKFEQSPLFPERVNTEFIQVLGPRELKMRVWERGSGETMACGTGACAAVAAAVQNGRCPQNQAVTVHLKGGDLSVVYTEHTVTMEGAAELAFTGEVEMEGTGEQQ